MSLIRVERDRRADALLGCFISLYDDVGEMVRRAEEIRQGELYTLRLRT